MFEEGNIVYFTPFYFKNGKSPAKPKYCIILKSVDGQSIIASLPTRVDSIPSQIPSNTGCVEMPEISLNAFIFDTSTTVTDCGKHFDFNTFVYGHQLDFYSMNSFNDLYRIEGTDYEIFGKLRTELYHELLNCLRNSKSVKKKFIALL